MNDEQLTISISKLEEAHNTSNRKWLAKTFEEASKVIQAGGRVKVTQEFSDASKELVAIIDNLTSLEHYKKRFMS